MPREIIAIASDHAAVALKQDLIRLLEEEGFTPLDLGTQDQTPVDYSDYAVKIAHAVRDGKVARGILLCGSGIGAAIAANRYAYIRAALVWDATGARLARAHNDANILCLGARMTGGEVARDCVRVFLKTAFEGGRHATRVAKLAKME
ncbi:MAG TPA: ribose 5-phosphate isomerase B [Dongiaceae bacterium]|jgi:ribose 5-phosphate isomerase B|nr:ribose 5-phosphate isomerase B [Dongiaceae bacterium]